MPHPRSLPSGSSAVRPHHPPRGSADQPTTYIYRDLDPKDDVSLSLTIASKAHSQSIDVVNRKCGEFLLGGSYNASVPSRHATFCRNIASSTRNGAYTWTIYLLRCRRFCVKKGDPAVRRIALSTIAGAVINVATMWQPRPRRLFFEHARVSLRPAKPRRYRAMSWDANGRWPRLRRASPSLRASRPSIAGRPGSNRSSRRPSRIAAILAPLIRVRSDRLALVEDQIDRREHASTSSLARTGRFQGSRKISAHIMSSRENCWGRFAAAARKPALRKEKPKRCPTSPIVAGYLVEVNVGVKPMIWLTSSRR
jgi:hypothetical protein